MKKKLQNACAMTEYADAKRALERLHRELMELNTSAARSLEEGMEETLTVHRLRVPLPLCRTLASTNVIESAFSIVETVCRNVKRWRVGDQIERWVRSGLLVAERQFHKVQGFVINSQSRPKGFSAISADLWLASLYSASQHPWDGVRERRSGSSAPDRA